MRKVRRSMSGTGITLRRSMGIVLLAGLVLAVFEFAVVRPEATYRATSARVRAAQVARLLVEAEELDRQAEHFDRISARPTGGLFPGFSSWTTAAQASRQEAAARRLMAAQVGRGDR
jgi:hypothetical protein